MSQIYKSAGSAPGVMFSLTGNSGTPATGNVTIETENTTVKFVSSASIVVQDFGLTNLLIGDSGVSINPSFAVQNVGVGQLALHSLTTGEENTCTGNFAGNALTSGSGNVLVGFSSGDTLTSGGLNTYVGSFCGTDSTLASGNVAVGNNALNSITTAIGNVCIGAGSGVNTTGSGSYNIIIGANVAPNSASNQIWIGNQGNGAYQQNQCFIAGIVGVTVSNRQMVTINSSTGQLGVASSSQAVAYTNVTHAMSPYTVLATDSYISVDCSGGAVTLNFPNTPTATQTWTVKDRTGNAAANNITLTTPGASHTFDGSTSFVMDANYSAIQLLANASNNYEVF